MRITIEIEEMPGSVTMTQPGQVKVEAQTGAAAGPAAAATIPAAAETGVLTGAAVGAIDAGPAPARDGEGMGPMITPPVDPGPLAQIGGMSDQAAGAAPAEMVMDYETEGE